MSLPVGIPSLSRGPFVWSVTVRRKPWPLAVSRLASLPSLPLVGPVRVVDVAIGFAGRRRYGTRVPAPRRGRASALLLLLRRVSGGGNLIRYAVVRHTGPPNQSHATAMQAAPISIRSTDTDTSRVGRVIGSRPVHSGRTRATVGTDSGHTRDNGLAVSRRPLGLGRLSSCAPRRTV